MSAIIKMIIKQVVIETFKAVKANPKKYGLYLYRLLVTLATTIIIFISGYIYLDVDLKKILFLHQNNHVVKSIDDDSIRKEMILALETMGRGATVAKINIGLANPADKTKTITFSDVISCQFNTRNCLISSKVIHPQWYEPYSMSKIDETNIEKNNVLMYSGYLREAILMGFAENSPICITVFEDVDNLDKEFLTFKNSFPSISEKLENINSNLKKEKAGSYITKACFNKIRHPQFNNVIYIFLFTFWYYGDQEPEMLNYNKVKNLLKGIGDKEKQNLIRRYAL